jgi:hypothetical protein
VADHFEGQRGMFRGVDLEHAGAEYGDRATTRIKRTLMSGGVDAPGQAADDRAPGAGEPTGKLARNASSVGRSVPSADDRDGQGIARLESSAREKDPWRVIDLTEQPRVARQPFDKHAHASATTQIDRRFRIR